MTDYTGASMAPWQWLYLAVIVLSTCQLVFGMVALCWREIFHRPGSLVIECAAIAGFFYATPYGGVAHLGLCAAIAEHSPVAGMLAFVWGIGAWLLMGRTICDALRIPHRPHT